MKKKLSKLSIKKVGEKNFEEFLDLIIKMAEFEKVEAPNLVARKRLKRDAFSKNPRYEAFLAKQNLEYVGFMIIYPTYSSFLALPSLFLEDIFVLKEFRKQKIGQKMFDYCVALAKKRGCGRMEWWTMNWNAPAINFYKKNKATKTSHVFYQFTTKQINNHLKKKKK